MSKTVILAEKPSQASAYADAFDHSERKDGYFVVSDKEFSHTVITYGFGHLVALFSPFFSLKITMRNGKNGT